ncbi:hypothetical protein ACLESD_02595 [Pyxidicoccus sp. 3LFB2]
MEISRKEQAKRRMMFVAGEDAYFLTYTLFVQLGSLKCTSPEALLKDYRKAVFLADFVSSPSLSRILLELQSETYVAKSEDKRILWAAYDRGVARLPLMFRLLYALEQRGLIGVVKDEHSRTLDIYAKDMSTLEFFATGDLYEVERKAMLSIRKVNPKIRTVTLPYMLERFFGKQGVRTWLD